jgi:L-alanine-DL-glutamate epimerase-like enolase superfamily enzyme
LQLDLPRCGGISGFIEVARLAEKYNIALCSHLMPQLSASLVAAFPNGEWVEYDNLLPSDIFVEDFSIHKGSIAPPHVSGHGVELTLDAQKAYTIHHDEIKSDL